MAILENEVGVTVTNNYKYYEKLGYEIPKKINNRGKTVVDIGSTIMVRVGDLPEKSSKRLTKICDSCDRKIETFYFAILKQRKNNGGKDICKPCSNRIMEIENAKCNNLKIKYPDVAEEFIKVDKKGYEDYTPEMLASTSNHPAIWKCKKCNHEWKTKVSDRTMNKSGCPACWGRVVSDKNRLSLLFPDLVAEWNTVRNGNLTPNDVTYGSHTEVWWKCSLGHEWKTPVHSRTVMKSGCSFCDGKQTATEKSLSTLYPSVAKEWNYPRNELNPSDYTAKSAKKVWWICEKGHEWKSLISNRTVNDTGCHECNLSKGERKIEEFLLKHGYLYKVQYTFNDCRNKKELPFDFALFDSGERLIYLIEFDGEQHFKPVEHFGGEAKFKSQQKMDKIKNEYCKANGINLIRIPYWEIDNISEILKEKLKL